jgi:hypothetical protein
MIRKTVLFLLAALAQRPDAIQAFVPVSPRLKTTGLDRAPPASTTTRHKTTLLYSNNNNNENNEPDWITRRIQRADLLGIRRDAVLTACYVLCRFLIYDLVTGAKDVPGWDLQDVVYLTGTASSAIVLVTYWTIAGLLTRSFENMTSASDFRPIQILVNVALCCPIWLATEHWCQFGPADIGGSTLDESVLKGFLGLSSAMLLGRAITSKLE